MYCFIKGILFIQYSLCYKNFIKFKFQKNALFTKMNNKLRFLFKKNLKNYIINYRLNFGGNIYVN